MKIIEFKNKIKETVGTIEFKNIANSNSVEMNIYGDIVSDECNKWSDMDVCPQDVLESLSDIGNKDLEININSCGGSVFAGIGIYNAIKQKCKGNISVNITGIGASIASVIAMCGDEINMGIGSQLMIHKPLCGCTGNAKDFAQVITMLDKVEESILDVYMANANIGVTREQIQSLMEAESYLTTDDCKKLFKNVVVNKNSNNISNSIKNKISKDEIECNSELDKELESKNITETESIEVENIEDDCNKENEEKMNELVNFEKELAIFLCEKLI